jgi:hypothetical protein
MNEYRCHLSNKYQKYINLINTKMLAVTIWPLLASGNRITRLQQNKYHETYEKFWPTNVIGNKNNTKKKPPPPKQRN